MFVCTVRQIPQKPKAQSLQRHGRVTAPPLQSILNHDPKGGHLLKKLFSPFYISLAVLAILAGLFLFVLQGYSTSGLLCLGIMGILCFYRAAFQCKRQHPKLGKAVIRVFTILLCIGLLAFVITEGCIIHASLGNSGEDTDYLLVLGAKVKPWGPSLSLRNRIDAAYDYLTAHPDCTAILSGGKGDDEHISEAQCMFESLTAMGIDENRLWMEDQSTSTWENLKFTLALIQEKTGNTPATMALVTSEYHLFRAGLFADRLGLDILGVPAATTLLPLKINYFIREAVAVWHFILIGGNHYA